MSHWHPSEVIDVWGIRGALYVVLEHSSVPPARGKLVETDGNERVTVLASERSSGTSTETSREVEHSPAKTTAQLASGELVETNGDKRERLCNHRERHCMRY